MLERTIRYAREKGLFVIADIKRGDIGSTAEAYADAWLGVTKVGEALCGASTPTASPSTATWARTASTPS